MDYRIRHARHDDAAAISRVIIAALRESNAQDYSAEVIAQVEQHFSPDGVAAWLSTRTVFVAMRQGELIATAGLDGTVVRSLFVHPAHQGLGIGRSLIHAVHAAAAGQGIEVLRVPSSITAEGFYTALGYRKIRDEFHGAERTVVMEIRLPVQARVSGESE